MPFHQVETFRLAENRCSFNKSHHLKINKKLWLRYTSKRKVQIFYDKEKRLVGLKPSDVGYSVFDTYASRNIVEFVAIPLSWYLTVGRHDIIWSKEDGMFVLEADVVPPR